MELLIFAETEILAEYIEIRFEIWNWIGVGIVIIDTETAAYVDCLERDALGCEMLLQSVDFVAKQSVRLHVSELRADMEMKSGQLYAGELQRLVDDSVEVAQVDAEFILIETGGDIVVRVRIDVGVDTERNFRGKATRRGEFRYDLKFGQRLHVETAYAYAEGIVDFVVRFTDTGKHD